MPGPKEISVLGSRKLLAPRSCGRIADFTFDQLCAQVQTKLLSADQYYITICFKEKFLPNFYT